MALKFIDHAIAIFNCNYKYLLTKKNILNIPYLITTNNNDNNKTKKIIKSLRIDFFIL